MPFVAHALLVEVDEQDDGDGRGQRDHGQAWRHEGGHVQHAAQGGEGDDDRDDAVQRRPLQRWRIKVDAIGRLMGTALKMAQQRGVQAVQEQFAAEIHHHAFGHVLTQQPVGGRVDDAEQGDPHRQHDGQGKHGFATCAAGHGPGDVVGQGLTT